MSKIQLRHDSPDDYGQLRRAIESHSEWAHFVKHSISGKGVVDDEVGVHVEWIFDDWKRPPVMRAASSLLQSHLLASISRALDIAASIEFHWYSQCLIAEPASFGEALVKSDWMRISICKSHDRWRVDPSVVRQFRAMGSEIPVDLCPVDSRLIVDSQFRSELWDWDDDASNSYTLFYLIR